MDAIDNSKENKVLTLPTELVNSFANKLADEYYSSLSKEEKDKIIKGVLYEIQCENRGYNERRSKLESALSVKFLESLKIEAENILASEEYKKNIHEEAKKVLSEIKQKTEEKLINVVSDRLSGVIDPYNNLQTRSVLSMMIDDFVRNKCNR